MASFNFVNSRIGPSTAINVYAVDAFGNQTGSSLFSGTTGADGSITVTGVTAGQTYLLTDGTNKVHFTVNTASGGAGVPLATVTAKGDLIAATGSGAVSALAVGSNNSVLTADSSQATGVKWAAASGGSVVANPNVPGLGFETMPRDLVLNNDALLSSGRLSLVPIWLPSGLTITSITFSSGSTAGASMTNQLFGIFDNDSGSMAGGSARALLRSTVDDGATAWASNVIKTLNLTSAYVTPTAGRYYLGIMVAGTTVPTIAAGNDIQIGPSNASPSLGGTSSTGLTSSLPNPAAAISAIRHRPYAYVS